jgi:DNA-binding transcriptional regulator YbjK
VKTARQPTTRGSYEPGRRCREALLDATLRIVASDGISAVTHRRVNAEAGVANGLTTYYFSTKSELLGAAYTHWIAKALERVRSTALTAAGAQPNRSRRESMIEILVEVTAGELETEDAAAGFALAREPALATDFGQWEERLLALVQHECDALGSSDSAQDAWIILSVIRGLQLAHLSGGGHRPDRTALRATLARLVESLTRSAPARPSA